MSQRAEEDPETIVVECDLPEPPEKVWRALTVPELVAAWLSPNDIKPEAGARFGVQDDGSNQRVECEVLAADPPNLIRYTWRAGGLDSVVTFQLAETGAGGTHLRLIHSGFVALPVAMSAVSRQSALAQPHPRRIARLTSRAAPHARTLRPLRAAA